MLGRLALGATAFTLALLGSCGPSAEDELQARVEELEAQLEEKHSQLSELASTADDLQSHAGQLQLASEELQENISRFAYDDWREVVPEVEASAIEVESADALIQSDVEDVETQLDQLTADAPF